jgi:HAD superfamily hydrolase (TIGR01458 family)
VSLDDGCATLETGDASWWRWASELRQFRSVASSDIGQFGTFDTVSRVLDNCPSRHDEFHFFAFSWHPMNSTMTLPHTIKAILFDIDGTLVGAGKTLPGAPEAVACARRLGLAVRFLTNTTSRGPAQIASDLRSRGFVIEEDEIQTAATACVEYLKSRPGITCHLIMPSSVRPMFDGIATDEREPDVVVICDIGEHFNFQVLNEAFLMLRAGAELVAPQKGLFWFDQDGPKLDCGSFIVGLEAATGKEATVTGKPSALFFQRALARVGCSASEALIVGDDINTDVLGARRVGARSLLVGTGKYTSGAELGDAIRPDYFLPTLEQLPQLLADRG